MSQQKTSLEYMKRFSMCNCLTVYFPETYTIHGVSVDLINKKAQPGKRIPQPFADLYEPHWGPKSLKIPKRIETFLYSPFGEAISPSFRYFGFDNGEVRYANGAVGGVLEQQGLATRVPSPTKQEHQEELRLLEQKVEEIWGADTIKILVYYDYSRASRHDIVKMKYQENITKEIFHSWPIVQVELVGNEPTYNYKTRQGEKGWLGWEHYKKPSRDHLLQQIIDIEEQYK